MLDNLKLKKELVQTQIAFATLRQGYDALLIQRGQGALEAVEREIRELEGQAAKAATGAGKKAAGKKPSLRPVPPKK